MKKQQGFSVIALIIILAVLAGGGYWVWQNQARTSSPLTSPEDTNIEPPAPFPSTPSVDTIDWKTYRNDKYGFEFEYPIDLKEGSCGQWDKNFVLSCFQLNQKIGFFVLPFADDPHNHGWASATTVIGKETISVNGLSWKLVWSRGSPSCDGPSTAGCENVSIAIYTNKNGLSFLLSRTGEKNREELSVEMLRAIISTFRFTK